MGYKIDENKNILLPMMVNMDGYVLSYTKEPLHIPSQNKVDKFLPKYKPLFEFNERKPIVQGATNRLEITTKVNVEIATPAPRIGSRSILTILAGSLIAKPAMVMNARQAPTRALDNVRAVIIRMRGCR